MDLIEIFNFRDNVEDSVEVVWLFNMIIKEEKFELGIGLFSCVSFNLVYSGENYVDVSCKFGVILLIWSDNVNDNGNILCLEDCERLNFNLVVVIMFVMVELFLEECFDFINSVNGEFLVVMLKDLSELCFLLSLCFCLENEILMDDEFLEDEIKLIVEEKLEKVRV